MSTMAHVTGTGAISGPNTYGVVKRVILTVTSGAGLITITDSGTLDLTITANGETNSIEMCYPYTGTLSVDALTGTGAEAWLELGV